MLWPLGSPLFTPVYQVYSFRPSIPRRAQGDDQAISSPCGRHTVVSTVAVLFVFVCSSNSRTRAGYVRKAKVRRALFNNKKAELRRDYLFPFASFGEARWYLVRWTVDRTGIRNISLTKASKLLFGRTGVQTVPLLVWLVCTLYQTLEVRVHYGSGRCIVPVGASQQ